MNEVREQSREPATPIAEPAAARQPEAAESEVATEAKAGSESKAESEAKDKVELEAEDKVRPEVKDKAELDALDEAAPDTKVEAGTESKVQAKAKDEAEDAAQPEAKGKVAGAAASERSGQEVLDRLRRTGERLVLQSRESVRRATLTARARIEPPLRRLGPQLRDLKLKEQLDAVRPWLDRRREQLRGVEPSLGNQRERLRGIEPWLKSQRERLRAIEPWLGRQRERLRGLEPLLRRAGLWLRQKADWSAERLRALGVAARDLVTERAVPATIDAGRRLRERVRPRVLKQDYRRFQVFAHRVVFDRTVERVLFAPSKNRIPLSQLRIRSLTRLSGRDYRPTPRLIFEWAIEAIPEPVKRFAFVDYGAGVGRVLLLASHWEFDKVRGVEFAEELYDDCLMNIAQYPRSRMKCRDVACELEDATLFDVPEQECVLYFFNPFGENVLREVMARVARSYDRSPRRIYVIAIDLPSTAAIDEWRIFERVPIERRLHLMMRLFSPYSVAIYRSIV